MNLHTNHSASHSLPWFWSVSLIFNISQSLLLTLSLSLLSLAHSPPFLSFSFSARLNLPIPHFHTHTHIQTSVHPERTNSIFIVPCTTGKSFLNLWAPIESELPMPIANASAWQIIHQYWIQWQKHFTRQQIDLLGINYLFLLSQFKNRITP